MKALYSFISMKTFARLGLLMGLSFSSAATAQQDMRYAYPEQLSLSPLGVNLQTGRLAYSKTDVEIGTLKFVRSWGDGSVYYQNGNMLGAYRKNKSFVTGWYHNFSQGVRVDPNSSRYFDVVADGVTYRYSDNNDTDISTYLSANKSARGAKLWRDATGYYLTNQSGTKYFFSAPSGQNAVLTWAEYANGHRIDYGYSASLKPHSIVSNKGYAILLDYDGFGNVTTACGFNTTQQFVDNNSNCIGASLKASYSYSADGQSLLSITDIGGKVTTITGYAQFGGPLCITKPNSTACDIENRYGLQAGDPPLLGTPSDAVRWQKTPTGEVWRYNYNLGEDPRDVPIVAGQPRWSSSEMTDPTGFTTTLDYDRGVLIDLKTAAGHTNYKYENLTWQVSTTTFDYHSVSPNLVTHPEGDREYYEYDDRENVIKHALWPKGAGQPTLSNGSYMLSQTDPDLARCCTFPGSAQNPPGSIIYTRTFKESFPLGSGYPSGCGNGPVDYKLCANPLTIKDARGNQTDYTYSPDHGSVLTETGPADQNGIRPQTRYSYVQRFAWVKANGTSYVKVATPIWLLASKSLCKTSAATGNPAAPCAGGTSDELRTIYEYGPDSGPNNLLLRGVVEDTNGLALRTCYTYDWRGNKVSETKPKGAASFGACP